MQQLLSRLILAAASLAANAVAAESDYREWQLQKLLEPTAQDRALDATGRVYIYDGLRDTDIEHAMETQFGRVANMMFVRTVITDVANEPLMDEATGGYAVEDDDCD